MMKQIIFSGAIVLTTAGLAHASCITADEIQQYKNIAEKAEAIKGQVDDSKSSYKSGTYKSDLELFNNTLTKASSAKAGGLCATYKKTLNGVQERIKDRAKSSGLTME